MRITKSLPVEMPITTEDVANFFCQMDEREQSVFFNTVAENVKSWSSPLCFQLQSVDDCPLLSDDGRKVMKEIGNYSGI